MSPRSDFSQASFIGLSIGYSLAVLFAKLSLFLLYFQIFAISRKTRILIHVGIVSISIFYVGTAITSAVLCMPRPGKGWEEAISAHKCSMSTTRISYLVSIFGVISDFYLLCLPIPVIWRMNMPRKKKVGVCAIFMTGFLWGFSLPS